jgi:hypothetical protein
VIASAKGADLFYTVRGRGPACLVLSTIGTDPYERLMPEALDDFLQLVFVDLRGGGKSTGDPDALTFDVVADDLDAIRGALGLERVAVLGHSILGVLAIEYARRRPDHVSHVIAVGMPPTGDMVALGASATKFFERDASADRKQVWKENRAQLPANASLRQTTQAQTPMRFFDARLDTAPLFADSVVKMPLLQHLMGSLTPDWDITAGASELTVPILLALGRYDYTVPHTLWDPIVGTLPGLTAYRFESSGHHPFFEEPDLFVDVVTRWMAVAPGSAPRPEEPEWVEAPGEPEVESIHEPVAAEALAPDDAGDVDAADAVDDEPPVPAAREVVPQDPRALALIDELGLGTHPEGGYYRPVYRSVSRVQPADDRSSRASLTTIYFLLAAGQHSRWHRVRSDEVWHFYEGDPIELLVADPELLQIERVRLGPVPDGMRPVYVVPAGWWQAARPTGAYGLVGCTVAPGFEFDDFSFLRDDPEMFRALRLLDPRLVDLA